MSNNPLLKPWNNPHGLPPFSETQPEHFREAMETGMQEHLKEIDLIATNPAPADFENTFAVFDRSGDLLNRVAHMFFNLCSSETSSELQEVERALAPKLAAHESSIYMHEGLFARVRQIHEKRTALGLSDEQLRLVERVHLRFVRSGAELTGEDRARFAAINEELASLYTSFSQAVLADEAAWSLRLETDDDRAGLPDFVLEAAGEVARERDSEGYMISLSPSIVDPFLTYSTRRDLREEVWRAFKARGEANPDHDTRPVASRIVKLRAELASLLGAPDYATFELEDRMAKTPQAVMQLLEEVWERARKRVAEEQSVLEDEASRENAALPLQPWDWEFWTDRVRTRKYQLDDAVLKPYFQLDRMLEAMFDCAHRLYGIRFEEVSGLDLYHPDVRAFEVRDADSGALTGLFLSDNFARASKRGGAWMSIYRSQSGNRPDGYGYPIVVNNNNFAKAPKGRPTLLSFDNVRTLFHEFGHALHGLLSNVTYETLSGTSVLRDFVELPSQIHENWALEPETLQKHALHATTGEPIPDELIERIRANSTFNQGYMTTSYTSCALIDMKLHSIANPGDIDIAAFEAEACRELGVPEVVGMRHRLPHFLHLFAGDGYSAGYYVYMWAEVLEADAFEAFTETGDAFNGEVAQRFRKHVLSAGDSRDPQEAYRAFRGHDPKPEAMMRKRGLL
ncbi:MAG: M3 family peptidase [Spirochaetaceae bacterium]|nr:MAG: M3 family peptidase [Spirochaetaceae bacterium]